MRKILIIFLAVTFLVAACKKDKNSIENPDGTIDVQKISLLTIEPIFKSDLSIKTGGKTSFDLSKHTYLEYGVCFGEDANPTINDNLSFASVSNGGEYEVIIDKKYIKIDKIIYIRAYVKNDKNGSIKYGNEVNVKLNPVDFDTKYVPGKYAGVHNLNIAKNILDALSATLPVDSVTGEKPDLSKGFDDTLTVRVVDGKVNITSELLGITVQGEVSANNTVKIKETKYDVLNLGTAVQAKNASIATSKDIEFSSSAIGSSTSVQLRLKANQIGSFTIPLDITTSGTFIKIVN